MSAADTALAGLRAQHPQTPAAVAALAIALADATVAQRSAQATLHEEAVRATMAAQSHNSAEQVTLQAAQAWQQAQTGLALTRNAHERRRALINDALTRAPLSRVPADATAALAGPQHAAARARIESALPAALRERARERAAQATALAQAAAARTRAARLAVLTMERHGSLVFERNEGRWLPPREARVLDPTGAGDVFATSFLTTYFDSGNPLLSARFANAAASFSIEKGGIGSIPTRAMVDEWIDLHPRFVE